MADIKLKRKKVTMPDEGCMLKIVWIDIANPLRDESGNIIYTDKLNAQKNLIPQYMEFVEYVTIPADAVASQTTIDTLLATALESVKKRAQVRANQQTSKATLQRFVQAINDDSKIDFTGTVILT